jgi:hypothetical protein
LKYGNTLFSMRIKDVQSDITQRALQTPDSDQYISNMQAVKAWSVSTEIELIHPLIEGVNKAIEDLPLSADEESLAFLDTAIHNQLLIDNSPFNKAQLNVFSQWISAAEQLETAARELKKGLILLALFRHIPQKELAETLEKPAPTLAKWSKQAEANFTPPPAPNFD